MENILAPGIKYTAEMTVEERDTASRYGSGLLPVFATPAMLGWMEGTAYKSVEPYLPQGSGTVGIEVHLQHLKASSIGNRLTCVSELTAVEGRKLTFHIQVYDGEVLAGEAVHSRFIVDNERFMSKLNKQ